MKKNYLLLSILIALCIHLSAQKVILVNGGQFGNPQENVNIQIYDPGKKISRTIDSIHTNSVQDLLIDGNYAFVAAQDSIVKYDLSSEQRLATASFNGFSTKALAVYQNYLLVGNWYGKSSHNLYIYDRNNLALLDSVQQITKGVASILVNGSTAFISQNSTTADFEDTLGYIAVVNLDSLQQVVNITPTNYTGDIGQLIAYKNSLLALNSVSNSILEFQNSSGSMPTVHQFQKDIQVLNPYQLSLYKDTLFLKWDAGLGSINVNNFQILDTAVLDTVITAFAFDTLRKQFYISQTDYFSYQQGGVYNRAGIKLDTFSVGFAPEIAKMYYPNITSLSETEAEIPNYRIYPNPATDLLFVEMENNIPIVLKMFDVRGKIVKAKQLDKLRSGLNLSQLRSGVYIIQLQSEGEGQVSSFKLIKKQK